MSSILGDFTLRANKGKIEKSEIIQRNIVKRFLDS